MPTNIIEVTLSLDEIANLPETDQPTDSNDNGYKLSKDSPLVSMETKENDSNKPPTERDVDGEYTTTLEEDVKYNIRWDLKSDNKKSDLDYEFCPPYITLNHGAFSDESLEITSIEQTNKKFFLKNLKFKNLEVDSFNYTLHFKVNDKEYCYDPKMKASSTT